LRVLRIVPQVGVFRLLVQLRQTRARLVEVKDASSAARLTAYIFDGGLHFRAHGGFPLGSSKVDDCIET